jgi:hypothetical protein
MTKQQERKDTMCAFAIICPHTDAQGRTSHLSTERNISATLHVRERGTPLGPYWDQ